LRSIFLPNTERETKKQHMTHDISIRGTNEYLSKDKKKQGNILK
jgi:hypothetical protein